MSHAQDRFIFVDIRFVSVITMVADQLPTLESLVVMTDKEHMPDVTGLPFPVHCYEDLIVKQLKYRYSQKFEPAIEFY